MFISLFVGSQSARINDGDEMIVSSNRNIKNILRSVVLIDVKLKNPPALKEQERIITDPVQVEMILATTNVSSDKGILKLQRQFTLLSIHFNL